VGGVGGGAFFGDNWSGNRAALAAKWNTAGEKGREDGPVGLPPGAVELMYGLQDAGAAWSCGGPTHWGLIYL
jgi:hypothetical protein